MIVRRRTRGGFTLLEVLVAVTIMAVVIGALIAGLTGSMSNARWALDSDRAAMLAKRTMDELLAVPVVPRGQILQGTFDPATGFDGGWRAQVTPFEGLPGKPPGQGGIDRITLEVWWMTGDRRRTFQIEGYRKAPDPRPGAPS
jgi:prepilin-type N-terminal cleavage/methylation domain-containing protein